MLIPRYLIVTVVITASLLFVSIPDVVVGQTFEDEETSCYLIEGAVRSMFTAPAKVNVCPSNHRNKCHLNTLCSCIFTQYESANVACTDGCLYSWDNYVIQSNAGMIQGWIPLYDGISTVNSVSSGRTKFVAGPLAGEYEIIAGAAEGCQAFLNGNRCQCQFDYCSNNPETQNFLVDCSGIEGGTIIDYCNFQVPESSDNLVVMELLAYGPEFACKSYNNGNTGAVAGIYDNVADTNNNNQDGTTTDGEEDSIGSNNENEQGTDSTIGESDNTKGGENNNGAVDNGNDSNGEPTTTDSSAAGSSTNKKSFTLQSLSIILLFFSHFQK